MHDHMKDAIEEQVQRRIREVLFWTGEGMSHAAAVARVLESSTFGPALRKRVQDESLAELAAIADHVMNPEG
jgi:hypothetical protein